MTSELKMAAIGLMTSSALTRCPVDNARAVLLLRLDPALMPHVLELRRRWLTDVTLWQRRWQRETRRPSHARHHDSIEIRERYVRCH